MRRIRRATAVVGGLVLVLGLVGCEQVQPWAHELVTVNAAGDGGGDDGTHGGRFSADGTKVVFYSYATNLVPGDTTSAADVYLRDLTTGTTTLVSHTSDGNAGNGGSTVGLGFSPDGTKILFDSEASDLVAADTNGAEDVFLYDIATDTISLVSVNAAGTASAAGRSAGGQFSPDGTKIAFGSLAADFGPTDSPRPLPDPPPPFPVPDENFDIYVRDITTGTTELVTANAAGTDSANARTDFPTAWSPDSTTILFVTLASDHGATDTNAIWDVYARDITTGTTELVSVNAAGTAAGNASSTASEFSPDGTQVLFSSSASDLGPPHTGSDPNLYLRDLTAGTTTLVSVDASGAGDGNGPTFRGTFSPDGTQVLFTTHANNLGPTDTNPWPDIYLRDLGAGITTLVSVNAAGTDASEGLIVSGPDFSPDGTKVVFGTMADDLGPTDTVVNTFPLADVYVKNLTTGTVTMVSARADGKNGGNGNSGNPVFSPDSQRVLFTSTANDLGPPDSGSATDLYIATLQGTDLRVGLTSSAPSVSPGDELTYTLDVENLGPRDAPDALGAMLVLPEGVSFVDVESTSGTCTPPQPEDPLLVTCEFGAVEPGFEGQVTVTTSVTAPSGTPLEALGGFGTTGVDPDHANNLVRVHTPVV